MYSEYRTATFSHFLCNFLSACSHTYSGEAGVISSPGYPSNYPNNLQCLYEISAPPDATITLTFSAFDIQPASPCQDTVVIRDVSTWCSIKTTSHWYHVCWSDVRLMDMMSFWYQCLCSDSLNNFSTWWCIFGWHCLYYLLASSCNLPCQDLRFSLPRVVFFAAWGLMLG